MTELENRIKKYADAYYRGEELISDAEYDCLIDQLRKEQPDSVLLGNVIGTDAKGVTPKYKLEATMGTLAKCNTDAEFKSWYLSHKVSDIMVELKYDGNSQLLTYKNGVFQYSRSRGNGEYGEDTTANISKIAFPKKLSIPFSGHIRCEVYMKRSVFEKYFSDGKNPRNMAAGIIKRLDGKDCEKLSIIAYDVFDDNHEFDKLESTKISFLESVGFDKVQFKYNPTFEEIVEWKNNLQTDGEIPCDGIVIKQNKVDYDDLMRHTPMNNVAYKPALQVAVTTVKGITWQLQGKVMSPVAEVEPVELEGTTVTRATLSNVNIMKQKGVYVGAKVSMSKHGLIIPQIDTVFDPKDNAFEIPDTCPVCGGKIVLNESGFPECVNPECPQKLAHRYDRMFKVLGVKGAGDVFFDNIKNTSIKDFLDMCKSNELSVLNVFAGGKNGEKIKKQMQKYLNGELSVKPAQIIAMLDEDGFDEKKVNQLGCSTIDEILSLTYDNIYSKEGFADITARAMVRIITECKDEILMLCSYFTLDVPEDTSFEDGLPTVCFTGVCPGMTRKELSDRCKGSYKVVDAVTKDLDILVCADPESGSSKLVKAKKNGTKIVSYDSFLCWK